MNAIVLSFEDQRVRLDTDDRGELLFCASDVAKCLGYVKTEKAIKDHCHAPLKRGVIDSLGRNQKANFIREPDLYRLIMHSKLPSAERFEKWVCEEVLPSINNTGGYSFASKSVTHDDARRAREQRLLQREQRLERRQKIDNLKRLADAMKDSGGLYSRESRMVIEVHIAEIATGEKLDHFLPPVAEKWESPTQIGDQLGVSANSVGQVITKLGIRGDKAYSRKILNRSKYSNREVESYLYNQDAVRLIKAAFEPAN